VKCSTMSTLNRWSENLPTLLRSHYHGNFFQVEILQHFSFGGRKTHCTLDCTLNVDLMLGGGDLEPVISGLPRGATKESAAGLATDVCTESKGFEQGNTEGNARRQTSKGQLCRHTDIRRRPNSAPVPMCGRGGVHVRDVKKLRSRKSNRVSGQNTGKASWPCRSHRRHLETYKGENRT